MKKALMIFSAVATGASSFAQGTLIFKTLGVQNAAGTGTYNVPIFATYDFFPAVTGTFPAGLLPGGVTIGLFAPNAATPFAIGMLGTNPQTGPFVVNPASQTVAVPGSPPGSTPTITIRAWQGGIFPGQGTLLGGEWTLTTKPLGGDPGGGALPITPPTLTGWGPENGQGFIVYAPEPATIAMAAVGMGLFALARRR